MAQLAEYYFKVHHKPERGNTNAGALSMILLQQEAERKDSEKDFPVVKADEAWTYL